MILYVHSLSTLGSVITIFSSIELRGVKQVGLEGNGSKNLCRLPKLETSERISAVFKQLCRGRKITSVTSKKIEDATNELMNEIYKMKTRIQNTFTFILEIRFFPLISRFPLSCDSLRKHKYIEIKHFINILSIVITINIMIIRAFLLIFLISSFFYISSFLCPIGGYSST